MNFLRISVISLLLFIGFFVTGNESFADHGHNHVNEKQLSQLADNIYLLVKNEKYNEASLMLSTFANAFMKVEEEELAITHKQMDMLALSFRNLESLLMNETIDNEYAMRQVTEFRFLLDALVSTYQPLWVEKETAVKSAFTDMTDSLRENNNIKFQASLNEFLTVYDLIYPALYVDLTTGQLEKVEMHVQFLDKYRATFANNKDASIHLAQIQSDFDKLFAGELEEDDTDPSLIWIMFSVGSIIFASLCFVGWRKYKGEKIERIKKVRDR
jgi:sporulation protein YpjB